MKVVITDHRFPDVEQERLAVHASGGTLVVAQTLDEQELAEACSGADGVLASRATVSRPVISAMKQCRIIVRYGIGVDTVDIAAATERGIMVANVPDYCIDEVSDHAVALLLMLSRQMIPAMALAREDRWALAKMPRLHRLRGQTCGLVGCGRIGSLVAGKVSQLGMNVVICDPYLQEGIAKRMGAKLVSFDELLTTADFISLHAPLNDQTLHLFDAAAFAKMKTSAYIVNTARGGLIDEPSLLDAINSDRISGAALDAVESESEVTPMRSALVHHPKMIVTAHTAWLSDEARAALQGRAVAQVLACLKGELPYGLLNKNVVPR